jgi:hypothetical protein
MSVVLQPLWPRPVELEALRDAPRPLPATMAEWLSGREPPHLSTNSGTPLVAFQAWRNFKEAFAPELVGQAFEETSAALGRPVKRSVDPFGGSGTTALASQFLGVHPTTIEVNPYLADLIEAKLNSYDVDALLGDYIRVVQNFTDVETEHFPGAPETFVQPGKAGRYLFSRQIAARLAGLRNAVLALENEAHRRLLRVLLCSIAVGLSNVVVSGKGRRYRRGWEKRPHAVDEVLTAFDFAFVRAAYDIRRYRNRSCLKFDLRRGDARVLTPASGEYDVAVFSPPYPNSFDYTDVYNVELWVGGYLTGRESNLELRASTLRSHVQMKRSYETADLKSSKLDLVVGELERVRGELWNSTIPDMVRAYFDDMNLIMSKLSTALVPGGRAYMVVGDSRYHGVQVPVAEILIELVTELGFQKVAEEPFRSMRASPQQGGKPELLETLITLQRA